ncbi:response regulator [Myxococcota bacterium]|nr:response regulator [Myxococcota bacterium]
MARILVNDDSQEGAEILRLLLGAAGHQVAVVHSGVQALATGRAQRFDLLVTDVLMPEMDGFELCMRWTADPALRAVPVMVYSASYADPQDLRLLLDLGAAAFVEKPQQPEALLSQVHEILVRNQAALPEPAPRPPEVELLRRHNRRLVAKLVEKVEELEAANHALARQVESCRFAEREAQQALTLFRLLADNARDVIYRLRTHPTLAFEYISPSCRELTGWSDQEFYADPDLARAAVHPQDLPAVQAALSTPGAPIEPFVSRRVRRDGSVAWVETRARAIRDDEGLLVAIEGIDRDVTEQVQQRDEQERLARQLQHAQKMEALGRLAGGVAHDFNNVLMVIGGHAQFALDKCRPDSPVRDDLEQVLKAQGRAAALTRQLLAFSRRQTSRPCRVLPFEVVSNLAKMLRRLLGEDVQLELVAPLRPLPVHIDPAQLEQALVNLAVNARDAMPGGGHLHVRVGEREIAAGAAARDAQAEPGTYVTVEVEDDGLGMDEATLSRAFEPFFTTKPEGRGTGLGLSLVFGFARAANGAVDLHSTPERGTRVCLLLPALDATPLPAAPPVAPTEAPRGTETVLVVDDDEAIRLVVQQMLEDQGYRVLLAADAYQAMQVVQTSGDRVDLVLSDIIMPGVSGIELVQLVRELRPGIAVLLMSGHTDRDLLRELGDRERPVLLDKPFPPDLLLRTVRAALDARPAR